MSVADIQRIYYERQAAKTALPKAEVEAATPTSPEVEPTWERRHATTKGPLSPMKAGHQEATDRQAGLHAFMMQYQKENMSPPTVREMAARMGISSPNGIVCHLKSLRRKGFLRIRGDGYTSRQFIAIDPAKPNACPCCGHSPPVES